MLPIGIGVFKVSSVGNGSSVNFPAFASSVNSPILSYKLQSAVTNYGDANPVMAIAPIYDNDIADSPAYQGKGAF